MRKISCCIVLIILLPLFCACSLKSKLPSCGIWYCEEIKITLEFVESDPLYQNTIVRWYDSGSDIEYRNLEFVQDYGGVMWFYYEDAVDTGYIHWVTVYEGDYKYKNDRLLFNVFRKHNPEDPYGDLLLVDESYVFTQIDDYDSITQ